MRRLCKNLEGVYYRKDLSDYHHALRGFLRKHGRKNCSLPVEEGELRRCEASMRAYLEGHRQQHRI